MNIRKAILDDAKAIATQNILLAKESEGLVLDAKTVFAGVSALLSDDRKGFYVVAEEDKKIIGQMMITFEWSDWRDTNIWWMQSVYVQKQWRAKGVFTKLFSYIQQQACKHHVSILRLYTHESNSVAQAVYQQIGMRKEPYMFYQKTIKK
ncbi:MAG: GNAT family N-acetyltransferase [Euryarchaeota archaeon]|nr:GNAT family N-acetyltransferase [Euryarchaeota archaeon]